MSERPVPDQDNARARMLAYASLGFVIPYLILYLYPLFLRDPVMFQPERLPIVTPVASDLIAVMEMGRHWMNGETPYQGLNLYPPLANVAFVALEGLGYGNAHIAVTLGTVALFLLILIVPSMNRPLGRRASSLLPMFVATGLLSYGVQFEVERGQFNILAMGLSLAGVWIFHARPRWTMLAYALFSAGIHLKLYPAILGLLLTHDWRDTKGNLRRLFGLASINILLLFATGPQLFADFVVALYTLAFKFGGWAVNHSIYSWVTLFSQFLARQGIVLPRGSETTIEVGLLLVLAACLFTMVRMNRRDNQFGLDPYLLVGCTIGAMLIPPISYDYKLSLLAPTVALAAAEFERASEMPGHPRAAGIGAFVVLMAAYTTTLFTYDLKPGALRNNCPILFILLFSITALSVMRSKARTEVARLKALAAEQKLA